MASQKGHLPIIQYLVEKEANLEAKNKYDKTPFQLFRFSLFSYTSTCNCNKWKCEDISDKKPSEQEKVNKAQQLIKNYLCGNTSLNCWQYWVNFAAKDVSNQIWTWYRYQLSKTTKFKNGWNTNTASMQQHHIHIDINLQS